MPNSATTLPRTAHAPFFSARLFTANGHQDGLLLSGTETIKLKLATPPPPGTKVTLALPGRVHGGAKVIWRQSGTCGIALKPQF